MLDMERKDLESFHASLSTVVVLYVFSYCDIGDIDVVLVQSETGSPRYPIPADIFRRLRSFSQSNESVPAKLLDCKPPALYLPGTSSTTCIGGLAGVLRWVVSERARQNEDAFAKSLLGFRGNTLAACSESSLWTRFCEIDIQRAVLHVQKLEAKGVPGSVRLPEELLLLEAHLGQPVKTHNIRRRKQEVQKNMCSSNMAKAGATTLLELEHRYVEGFDRTLADVIIFPCVHLCLLELRSRVDYEQLLVSLPLILKWYNRIIGEVRTGRALATLEMTRLEDVARRTEWLSVEEVELPRDSLYSTHPERTKPRIRHKSPSEIIGRLASARVIPNIQPNPGKEDLPLPWGDYPNKVHPAGGGLPSDRVTRKCQQIENIVVLALKLAVKGSTVVDFCSGGGHVGIVLAYLLPECNIVMIENKEESMHRARERIAALGLDNVTLYQCNMDYYRGRFDLGVSLHACGVATDVVLRKCIDSNAAFVSCPCCYGAMKSTAGISYPLSKVFRDTGISALDYVLLCHYADRTETNTATCEQGHYCMGLVDRDRSFWATEYGYDVVLTQMWPRDCSPKGLVLVGKPVSW